MKAREHTVAAFFSSSDKIYTSETPSLSLLLIPSRFLNCRIKINLLQSGQSHCMEIVELRFAKLLARM